jgi:radical SAM superfamily enzyme YgiQ (UPF0313 family)
MKIALIAMSGIRAHNPELTEMGMTLPGFVERGQAIASLPSLSLLTLAALTPERHQISYHEIHDITEVDSLPDAELVAMATFTAQVKDAYQLSHRYRKEGVTTVMGGLHVTSCAEEALGHADIIVIGEGEVVWRRLLEDVENGRAERVYDARGCEWDLAEAPVPRFDLLDAERYNRITVQTNRGCPWRCEFCASSILLTPRYKLKPVARVIEEIRAVKDSWPRPFIEFADDNSFVNKRRSRELVEAMGSEGVRWFTETDISVAEDPELLGMLREAGCAEVLIGLESPTVGGLDGVELKRNWKLRQIEGYREAITRIQGHGVAVNACFILGLDGDGPEIFDAVESFVAETEPFDVQITVQTPFPGTPLYDRLRTEGRLLEEGAWEKCTLFDVNYLPLGMTPEQLERGLIELGRRLYSEESTRSRRRGFIRQWREGRQAGSSAEFEELEA